jgi:hypothetical protein
MFAGSESSMDPTAACDHLRHDHRQMEECLDRLFAAVSHSGPELVSQVRSAMSSLQRLEAAHFEKEESLFYPKLRPTMRGLLIMSHQRSSGALPFGRERLCPTDHYCAFSANSSYLVLLRKQSI